MTDIYRISFVKLLRALAEQARNDFADEVFDAESTGERPDLEPAVVEIAVEFAEDISDAIEALQARVLEHDRIVAEKDAEIARLLDAARDVVLAYLEANPMRTADIHPASCGCLRCEIDRLGNACGSDPCGALDAAAIRAMKIERG